MKVDLQLFQKELNLAASSVLAPIHPWPPRMNSVSFWTGIGLRPFDPYTFSRLIAMTSMTTNVPKLNLHELFAFLTNLGDEFYTGTISRAKRNPYQKQITVFCRRCSDKVPMFVVYTDEDAFAFALMIRQFCPHQKWTIIESANRRGKTMVSRPWPKERNEWANEHPFRVICKMLLRLPLFPHDLRGYYTERLFSKSHQWRLRLETQSFASFDHLIDSLPGYVRLYGTNVAADLPFAYQGGSVVWCVWIPPWALDVLHSCSYLQLDASFREIRPYVYSIPLGIRANESFPLAVVFGLVESFELYQLFEEAMLKPGVARDVLNQKPILSDQHPSLMSIGFDRRHFWCLRHLVEKFGAKSYLGEMTSRLTF